MADKMEDIRQLVTKQLRVLRTLQAFQTDDTKSTINEFATRTNMPWYSMKNVLNDFIAQKIIDKNYKIIPSSAYFMGISMSQDKFNISIVGLDGKKADFKIKKIDKFKLEYSLSSIIEISKHITDLINDLKSKYAIKAVCLSFDDVNLVNKTFSTYNYFSEKVTNMYPSYPFERICNLWFKKHLTEDIDFFLDSNSVAYALSKKFPCIKEEGNQVYLHLSKTGCFVTPVIDGKIHYGYNNQTLNLSGLLDEKEKKKVLSDTATTEEKMVMLKKLIDPFIITLAPNYVAINNSLFSDSSNLFDQFFFSMPNFYGNLFNGYLYPDYEVDFCPDISTGSAISAMYQYYGWNLKFI